LISRSNVTYTRMSDQRGRDCAPRVLVVYTELLEYRVGVFEALAEHCNMTVVHSGKRLTDGDRGFEEIVIPVRKLWRLRFQAHLFRVIKRDDFSVVIFFMDIAWVSTVIAFLRLPRCQRRLTWGIWRTGFFVADCWRLILAKRAHCNIVYSHTAAKDLVSCGVSPSRITVAVNTIRVRRPGRNAASHRNCVLVVGSFNKRKQNDVTLRAFAAVAERLRIDIRLVFVGAGVDRERIERLAQASVLRNRIEFHEATHDEDLLRSFHDHAVCSVSFGQAGLSVLQSFAFGVPFVTRRDAITGGEREHVIHRYNGLLCEDTQGSLEESLEYMFQDSCRAQQLGQQALDSYLKHASVHHMVSGFLSAMNRGDNE
jgi:glycosyltransferase involved in cell wall biosynthesis